MTVTRENVGRQGGESHVLSDTTANPNDAPRPENVPDVLDRLKSVLGDRYTIERELGTGGMAIVYLAEDLKHRRKGAIKVLRPERVRSIDAERFLREIEFAAALTHPNILPLHDSGETDGFLYYVMPYVEGQTLRHRLFRERRLSFQDAIQITTEVAGALSFAHRQCIVHRDIKPENILLADGKAVVADFGIAKAICDACDDNITLGGGGGSVGTPAYMSPEQALGEEVDPRADVYSLGCVLYEMLTGTAPYRAANAKATLVQHVTHRIPSVREVRPDVPEQLDTALKKALAKDAADRTAAASEFAESLQRIKVESALAASRSRFRSRGALLPVVLFVGLLVGWWRTSVSIAGASPVQSLAVLPFANLSGDPEQQYFVDGMHDALITELAQIQALTVLSHTSVLRYRDTHKSIPEIGSELSVDAVLEGSVFKAGDSVRITAQLIGVVPERHLWARTYDRGLGNVLRLHNEVAQAIARAIGAGLTPQEEARLSTVSRADPEAHDAFLPGRLYHAKGQ